MKQAMIELVRAWEFDGSSSSTLDIFSPGAIDFWNNLKGTRLFSTEDPYSRKGSFDIDVVQGQLRPSVEAFVEKAANWLNGKADAEAWFCHGIRQALSKSKAMPWPLELSTTMDKLIEEEQKLNHACAIMEFVTEMAEPVPTMEARHF